MSSGRACLELALELLELAPRCAVSCLPFCWVFLRQIHRIHEGLLQPTAEGGMPSE